MTLTCHISPAFFFTWLKPLFSKFFSDHLIAKTHGHFSVVLLLDFTSEVHFTVLASTSFSGWSLPLCSGMLFSPGFLLLVSCILMPRCLLAKDSYPWMVTLTFLLRFQLLLVCSLPSLVYLQEWPLSRASGYYILLTLGHIYRDIFWTQCILNWTGDNFATFSACIHYLRSVLSRNLDVVQALFPPSHLPHSHFMSSPAGFAS